MQGNNCRGLALQLLWHLMRGDRRVPIWHPSERARVTCVTFAGYLCSHRIRSRTTGNQTMFRFTKDHLRNELNAKIRFSEVRIAFQPIVDARSASVWGYEALTRGVNGESYPALVADMDEGRRMAFDKLTTARALREASRLGLIQNGVRLTLNVRPTADLAAVDAAFVARAAKHYNIPKASIVLELTEDAKLSCADFHKVVALHRSAGIATGIDDFGSGYSGLNVLATCGADLVKLDKQLVRGIDSDATRQIIVESFARLCERLGSLVVAEGVETREEAETLGSLGIDLMQGYYFGRPVIGTPPVLRFTIGEHARPRARMLEFSSWNGPVTRRA